jgi:hypothetical protein
MPSTSTTESLAHSGSYGASRTSSRVRSTWLLMPIVAPSARGSSRSRALVLAQHLASFKGDAVTGDAVLVSVSAKNSLWLSTRLGPVTSKDRDGDLRRWW